MIQGAVPFMRKQPLFCAEISDICIYLQQIRIMTKLQTALARILQGRWTRYVALLVILASISAVIAASFREMEVHHTLISKIFYFSSFIFLLEYLARIYAAPVMRRPHRKPYVARLRYVFSFYGFVDFVAILPWVMTYIAPEAKVMEIMILPYIFIIFKLIRHSSSFRLIGQALVSVKGELLTAYTACFIVVSFSAILMYYIERNAQPDVFCNIGEGFWWSIVTFTTTGYGDIYPITPLGKILGGIISMIGIAMIAIPTAIISSSFISIVQKKEKESIKDSVMASLMDSLSELKKNYVGNDEEEPVKKDEKRNE